MILLDTNVLIYATDVLAVQHVASKRVVDATIARRIDGVIIPQVLVEYVAATTGPSMRHPLSIAQACDQAETFRSQIKVLLPPLESLEHWAQIVRETGRAGRRIFDTFLAAQARSLGASAICTYNIDDFRNITGVIPVRPDDISIPEARS